MTPKLGQLKRKFDGKVYKFYDSYKTKKDAKAVASKLRDKGYLVRITTPRDKLLPYYELWTRKKGR
jgi:hypothetical protein